MEMYKRQGQLWRKL